MEGQVCAHCGSKVILPPEDDLYKSHEWRSDEGGCVLILKYTFTCKVCSRVTEICDFYELIGTERLRKGAK